MTAGWGAEQQARQAQRRVGQKRRELAAAEQQAHAWAAGAEGERLVAAELDTLEPYGWHVLHDVHWPGRPRANLDHVLVGPGGVVVVDSKNWSGDVEVRNGLLRANGYGKSHECEAVATEVAAVAAFLEPQYRSLASGVLCLVQQDVASTPSEGITIVGRSTVAQFCMSRPTVLGLAEVAAIAGHLRRVLAGPTSPAQLTAGQVLRAAGSLPGPTVRPRPPAYRRRQRPAYPPTARARRLVNQRRPGSNLRWNLAKVALVVLLLLTAQAWLPIVSGLVGEVLAGAVTPHVPAVVESTPSPGGPLPSSSP